MNQDSFDNDTRRVKEASDIVDVVGEHVSLRPKGREFVALCPFHDDHNPSMAVIPHKQIFYCPACGTGGDVLSFVQKYHRMEFPAALEYLATRAGIELTPRSAKKIRTDDNAPSSESVAAANDFARHFFRTILAHPEHGTGARKVIETRGISPEMVELFELGASPDRYDGLMLKAKSSQFDETALVGAGLVKDRDGRRYDAYRNRLIFPIHDQMGRIIAFGARRINDEDDPKYLNSPESPLFSKSRTLYGLRQASRSIQRERVAVIVEGYTDVIACHQAGLTNAVATLGTALTTGHARILRRLCDTVVLLFDGDDAGQRAADRAVEVFFTEPVDVKIATLATVTDAKDPDELLAREGGLDTLKKAIGAGVELLEFRFRRIRATWEHLGPAALNKALTEEVRTLARFGLTRLEPTARALVIRRLHELTGLDDSLIAGAIRSVRSPQTNREPQDSQVASKPLAPGQSLAASESVIGCLLVEPKLWRVHADELALLTTAWTFDDPETQAVADCVLGLIRSGSDPTLEIVLSANHNPPVQAAAVALANATELQTDRTSARVETLLKDCLSRLGAQRARHQAAAEEDPIARLERERETRKRTGSTVQGNPWRTTRPR
jgi:DNA primase